MDKTIDRDVDGAVDMTGKHVALTGDKTSDDVQSREKAKVDSPKLKGTYIVLGNLKCDGVKYKRGDVFKGEKMYPSLEGKIIPKSDWEKR